MKTQLRGKYERKFESFKDELEDKSDIKIINDDLKTLAEPAKESYLDELIEKLKEIKLDLDIDYETPFELTDSQIIAINLFFKL